MINPTPRRGHFWENQKEMELNLSLDLCLLMSGLVVVVAAVVI